MELRGPSSDAYCVQVGMTDGQANACVSLEWDYSADAFHYGSYEVCAAALDAAEAHLDHSGEERWVYHPLTYMESTNNNPLRDMPDLIGLWGAAPARSCTCSRSLCVALTIASVFVGLATIALLAKSTEWNRRLH
ncbi:membrane protein UL56A [Psittacid alphaherpesvirus 1]|uniref:membrane protein UL56A n=1 Tax=Psittacid alphaherpesvirus 1 TaxID=50294 RepID=UPI0001536818|nr:membrane protein UL56A [Psittacid alphaherpesvirus 1]